MNQMGRIPGGQSFEWDNYHFTVVAMDGFRVERVEISRIEAEE